MEDNQKIKVLYLFDKYLNSTMNWAHRLIIHTPNISPIITSPIIVENEFFDPNFEYIFSPFQFQMPKNEWEIGFIQKGINYLTNKQLGLYKRYLVREIRKQKIDLIHVHFGNVAADYLDMLETVGIPFIVTFHGYDYELIPFVKDKYQKLYQKIFKKAALITCGGDFSSQSIKDKLSDKSKVKTLKLGVNGKALPFWEREKKSNTLRLVQASTFSEKKGHIYTLMAFHQALKNCPNMDLTLLGEFQDKAIEIEVKAFIELNGLSEKIKIQNILPYKQFFKFLEDYHVFIQPSCWSKLKDRESAPIVILDAQATGMPIISTNHADIPEEVIQNKTGLLAPERDVEILSQHIQRFYEMNQKEYDEFSQNARQHVVENYDAVDSGKLLFGFYKSILKDDL